jgi:hypothetical protein
MTELENMQDSQPEAQIPEDAGKWKAECHRLENDLVNALHSADQLKKENSELKLRDSEHEKKEDLLNKEVDSRCRQVVRPTEYGLLTPFLRKWPEDRKLGEIVLEAFASNERELGWVKHYFIEPLQAIRERTTSKTANYMFKKITKDISADLDKANKSAHYTLAQIEGLLQTLSQRTDLCKRVAQSIDRPNESLVRAFAGVDITDAFRAYALDIREHVKAYLTLPPEGKAILSWRLRDFGDNLEGAEQVFLEKSQGLGEEYKRAYETIRTHEKTSRLGPVNLQWFSTLPKDIDSFIGIYS